MTRRDRAAMVLALDVLRVRRRQYTRGLDASLGIGYVMDVLRGAAPYVTEASPAWRIYQALAAASNATPRIDDRVHTAEMDACKAESLEWLAPVRPPWRTHRRITPLWESAPPHGGDRG